MKQREMARLLRREFPLMDAPFLNKCLQPDRSGGQLTERALEIIGAKKCVLRRERPGTKKITFRAGTGQIVALQRAKTYMGIKTDQMILQKAIDTALDAWGIYAGGKA